MKTQEECTIILPPKVSIIPVWDDVNLGTPNSCKNCALARAFNRIFKEKLGEHFQVQSRLNRVSDVRLVVNNTWEFCYWNWSADSQTIVRREHDALSWMSRFDRGEEPDPDGFSFIYHLSSRKPYKVRYP